MRVLLHASLGWIPGPEGHALNVRAEIVCPVQEGIANWRVNVSLMCSAYGWTWTSVTLVAFK